jgi:hypothetical protein
MAKELRYIRLLLAVDITPVGTEFFDPYGLRGLPISYESSRIDFGGLCSNLGD